MQLQKTLDRVIVVTNIENAKFNGVIWSLEAGKNLVYALGFEQVHKPCYFKQ